LLGYLQNTKYENVNEPQKKNIYIYKLKMNEKNRAGKMKNESKASGISGKRPRR